MDQDSSDDREVRAAENQSIFRAVNESMGELNEAFGEIVGAFEIVCECDQLDCVESVELPLDAYKNVRRNPRMFVVLPEHVAPGVERVVSTHDGYTVVEAIGRGAHVAEATFRGGRPSLRFHNQP